MNFSMDAFWHLVNDILGFPMATLGKGELSVGGVLKLVCWVILVMGVERMFRHYLATRILSRTQLSPSLQFAIGRIAGYLFVILGCYLGLQVAGIDLSSLAIVAGAVGVGIGFGLQNIINNFVSGLIILAERPIALGDRVEVGGVAGLVTQISLRSTTVVTNDNISIIVPNSEFIANPVTNWSHGDPKVRLRLPLGVAYGSDIEKLKRVIVEVALAHPATLQNPAPSLFFTGFGDSSLDFELGVWTVDLAANPLRYRSDLYYAMERALREHGIEIPFPQRDLHVRSGVLAVRTAGDRVDR